MRPTEFCVNYFVKIVEKNPTLQIENHKYFDKLMWISKF